MRTNGLTHLRTARSAALALVALALLAPPSRGSTAGATSTDGAAVSTKELGCVVGAAATTFRVFAPAATSVALVLYDRFDAEEGRETAMTRDADGVWEASVPVAL